MSAKLHSTRKHSKFSASAAERWFNCQGSVALSEGLPDKETVWSVEGTKAHEVLESMLSDAIKYDRSYALAQTPAPNIGTEMVRHAANAANFILGMRTKRPHAEILVETRIYLDFIHPEMFGTFDSALVEHFGMLDVLDYKYGQGHVVSPGTLKKPNLQAVFYGLGLAAKYDWNFKKVRLWIIQPRVRSYDGPLFLEMTIDQLKRMTDVFEKAVERVEKFPDRFQEGPWCHFCKAKSLCPLKQEKRLDKAISAFSATPL